MSDDQRDERKIQFHAMDSSVDDFLIRRPPLRRWQTDDFRPRRRRDEFSRPMAPVTLGTFLRVELTRDYLLEQDEDRFTAKREKIYSFFKIPREVEKFMAYGFFQCADSFLFVFTFLPVRFVMALWAILVRPFQHCFGQLGLLKPAEVCDALKGIILLVCCLAMSYIDTSMMYHLIKSQSIIKLYIFYNMLEVGDRLFSAFGQDTIDALLWTATEPRGRKREHFGLVPHLLFAVIYVFLHSLLVLFQATTLNVAINSSNKALLTIMMSNNFVELKGSVFKKFDKNNLFQVACSDVRERFHLFILLFIVVLQTMKEYSWREERFWVLLPDCMVVLIAEVFVDWVKHAFITRFNELPVDVYRDYTTSLAYDTAQTRQKHAVSDHSDLVARRMGFIPLPLSVVMIRVLVQAVHVNSPAGVILVVLAYVCLASFRILNSLIILGKACDLMTTFESQQTSPEKPLTPCSSPILDHSGPAILTNSNVTLASLGNLNESLLLDARPLSEDESQETPPESENEDEEELVAKGGSFFQQRTRSEPSISLSDREQISTDYNLSGLSVAGSGCFRSWSTGSSSHQSTYSVSRPWSRVSRHRWRESTLTDRFEAAKTAWPVPLIEAAFLPEFKIGVDINEQSFELLGSLASGSYGKVYHVRKRDTEEEFALKVLSKSQLISESGVNQVKNEVGIQSMCGHHPFILNCPYYWQSRKKLFIVSEYMPGGELLALWQKYGALPQPLVKIYISELALAIDFLHNAGVIFRDLKLENVMLDGVGHLKVIDFGMAKWLKYGERTKTLCGTVRYMAPEVISMEPYGHAVDWWSLGIIAYCLITGDFPARSLRNPGAPAAPERCDVASRDLLGRLLQVEPQKRLRSLLTMQNIAFFKDFSFADARARKSSPKQMLEDLDISLAKSMKEGLYDLIQLPEMFHLEGFD